MSGKLKRAWSSDKSSGSADPPARKAVETRTEQTTAGHGAHRDTEDVETLVGSFLKELDALASELRHGTAGESERKAKAVTPPQVARDAGIPEPAIARGEERALHEREEPEGISDIDAELTRTLDELEMQERSHVVLLLPAGARTAAPGREPAALPEPGSEPAPEGMRQTRTAEEVAGTAPHPERVLFSSAGLSKPGRDVWKPVVRAAAAVFLAGAAFAVYRLLPVAPNTTPPSSLPAETSPAKPQITTPPPTSTSYPAGESAEIAQTPESAAPKSVTSAAKPSKTPVTRPLEPDRTAERPAEKPAPKKESAPPEPNASQAVMDAPAPANRTLGVVPEPPPTVSQAASPTLPEVKLAVAERETQPSTAAIPPEPQATLAAKPAPQAAPPSQSLAQEGARPGAETSRAEDALAKTPVANAPGGAVKDTAAMQPTPAAPVASYTPPVAIDKPAPVYPLLARNTKTTGTVEVEVEVDEQGKVLKAVAVSGPSLLRAAAEDALRRWRFKPAVRNGVNVRSLARISVVFRE